MIGGSLCRRADSVAAVQRCHKSCTSSRFATSRRRSAGRIIRAEACLVFIEGRHDIHVRAVDEGSVGVMLEDAGGSRGGAVSVIASLEAPVKVKLARVAISTAIQAR
jgi:hypothetical protein